METHIDHGHVRILVFVQTVPIKWYKSWLSACWLCLTARAELSVFAWIVISLSALVNHGLSHITQDWPNWAWQSQTCFYESCNEWCWVAVRAKICSQAYSRESVRATGHSGRRAPSLYELRAFFCTSVCFFPGVGCLSPLRVSLPACLEGAMLTKYSLIDCLADWLIGVWEAPLSLQTVMIGSSHSLIPSQYAPTFAEYRLSIFIIALFVSVSPSVLSTRTHAHIHTLSSLGPSLTLLCRHLAPEGREQ